MSEESGDPGGARGDPPHRRRHREQPGQPRLVGPQRRRVPDRARRLPRRRPLRVGPRRAATRSDGRAARDRRRAGRPRRTGDRLRRRAVLALAGRRRAPGRWRSTCRTGSSSTPGASTTAPDAFPLVQADAARCRSRTRSFDLACSAYGAVPFVADSARVMRETHRVLRPGGRWVFSVTHPVRWAFPDEPGPEGLTVSASYFDRTPVRGAGRGRRARSTSSTTARWATGCGRSRRPGSGWWTWSSRNGRPGTARSGAAGPRCAAHLIPGTAIFVCVGTETPPVGLR